MRRWMFAAVLAVVGCAETEWYKAGTPTEVMQEEWRSCSGDADMRAQMQVRNERMTRDIRQADVPYTVRVQQVRDQMAQQCMTGRGYELRERDAGAPAQ